MNNSKPSTFLLSAKEIIVLLILIALYAAFDFLYNPKFIGLGNWYYFGVCGIPFLVGLFFFLAIKWRKFKWLCTLSDIERKSNRASEAVIYLVSATLFSMVTFTFVADAAWTIAATRTASSNKEEHMLLPIEQITNSNFRGSGAYFIVNCNDQLVHFKMTPELAFQYGSSSTTNLYLSITARPSLNGTYLVQEWEPVLQTAQIER